MELAFESEGNGSGVGVGVGIQVLKNVGAVVSRRSFSVMRLGSRKILFWL